MSARFVWLTCVNQSIMIPIQSLPWDITSLTLEKGRLKRSLTTPQAEYSPLGALNGFLSAENTLTTINPEVWAIQRSLSPLSTPISPNRMPESSEKRVCLSINAVSHKARILVDSRASEVIGLTEPLVLNHETEPPTVSTFEGRIAVRWLCLVHPGICQFQVVQPMSDSTFRSLRPCGISQRNSLIIGNTWTILPSKSDTISGSETSKSAIMKSH
jgi:hypothetical protein